VIPTVALRGMSALAGAAEIWMLLVIESVIVRSGDTDLFQCETIMTRRRSCRRVVSCKRDGEGNRYGRTEAVQAGFAGPFRVL
jgi:hypothetical protein